MPADLRTRLRTRLAACAVAALLVAAASGRAADCVAEPASCAPSGCCPDCVVVALDLDAATPGFQTELAIAAGTRFVRGVEVWIYDPQGSRPLHSVGYLGGLNRGLAFGHAPDPAQHGGRVVDVVATALHPVVPGHAVSVDNGTEALFAGPEIQYFEEGPFGGPPGTIPAQPAEPVMTLDIELADATAGDRFAFHLGDMTAVWSGSGGAFSATALNSLESGGDACPDDTATLAGLDPDVAVPVPPAIHLVDYVDGPGGAHIEVVAALPSASALPRIGLVLALGVIGALGSRQRAAATFPRTAARLGRPRVLP